VKQLFIKAFNTAKKHKRLILAFAFLYVVSLVAGMIAVKYGVSFATNLRDETVKSVQSDEPFRTIFSYLEAGNLAGAIGVTFLFNFIVGAFFSTTLWGLLFFMPALITISRGFLVGAVYFGLFGSISIGVLAIGTLVLELGAYCFSAAAGTLLGWSLVRPQAFGVKRRREAFGLAVGEMFYLYVFVVVLLLLGAVWEMGGIYLSR